MSVNVFFSSKIQQWYSENKRDLPWRHDIDPYRVWLSEIILQQTRVSYGESYFNSFITTFPDVHLLAAASEEKVLKLWQGLGYYNRARNLHKTAILVANNMGGIFPTTYKDLLALPGVGSYTAAAISSICYHKLHAVVDGNVYRVLSRFFGIKTPIDLHKSKKQFETLANDLLDTNQPGNYNQAIMEFGALQCTPKSPNCDLCILNQSCVARQTDKVSKYPYKKKNKTIKKRYFNYIVPLLPNNKTTLIQRKEKDIWQHLYEFPLIQSKSLLSAKKMSQKQQFLGWTLSDELYLFNPKPWVHQLTHQHIYASFWIAPTVAVPHKIISTAKLTDYPVSRLIERFLHKFFD